MCPFKPRNFCGTPSQDVYCKLEAILASAQSTQDKGDGAESKRTAQEEIAVSMMNKMDSLDVDAQRMLRAVPQQSRTSIIGGFG